MLRADLLRSSSRLQRLLFFNFLLYLSQGVGRIAHPLLWENQHHLFYLSYLTLSLTANSSFMLGIWLSRTTPEFGLKMAGILYAAGTLLRLLEPTATIAVISGFLAGLGIALMSVSLRPYMQLGFEESERSTAMGLQISFCSIGTTAGRVLCSVFPLLFVLEMEKSVLLALAAVFALCASFCFRSENTPTIKVENKKLFVSSFPFQLTFLSLCFGCFISGVDQNLVYLLKDRNFNLSSISMVLALSEAMRAFCYFLMGKWIRPKMTVNIYTISSILLAVMTFLLAFKTSFLLILIILLLQSVAYCLTYLTKEVFFLQHFPENESAKYSGWIHTTHSLGVTLGSVLSMLFHNIPMLFQLFSLILILPLILFFFNWTKKKKEAVAFRM
ncbi:MAG: MFS transporter [Candidatus Melainabacteria bacterium]|nr:MFS transporter [Candidatus Melainabacteria bacterium]